MLLYLGFTYFKILCQFLYFRFGFENHILLTTILIRTAGMHQTATSQGKGWLEMSGKILGDEACVILF